MSVGTAEGQRVGTTSGGREVDGVPAATDHPAPERDDDTAAPAHHGIAAPAHDDTAAPAHDDTAAPAHDDTAAPAHHGIAAPAHDDTAAPAHRDTAAPAHDVPWFDDLVRTHATPLHRYLARRVDRSDVEDLAADVLAVAWRRRDEVPDGHELAWVYRTAGFVVANHRRKQRPVLVADVPDEPDDDDPALRAVRDDEVRTALAALSPRDRQIVLLHAWEGLTGEALAAVLGITRGGADAALSRARSRLAAAWRSVSD
ncbi:RNA polymerase sigma factor [Cellulomonas sp. HZM]|uniref:RNA polymerase sigma factor n=1 Tax=Cellulomonas sp. HZM TaxID=1454010 RepID=UPI001E40BCA1|nr:sigma-70 family RNA polymerase sigma factor [Cellulomonas sp. HZM]